MIKVLLKLAGIFVLAYAAVHLGYAKLEKELLTRSCFDIAGLQTPGPITQEGSEEGTKLDSGQAPVEGTALEEVTNTLPTAPESGKQESGVPADLLTDSEKIDYEHPDFQAIIRRNIFQLVQQEQPVITEELPTLIEEKTAAEEVQTALNLTLLGTVMGDDQTSRAIIIEEKKNEQKLYQIGDAVQGAIIESIERGKVVLDVFGARETLLMKKREGGGPGLPSLPARSSVRTPEPQQPPDLIEEDLHDDEEELEEQEVQATTRRPPSIRPHLRINFRRNPIRTPSGTDEEEIGDEEPLDLEEELPPLD